MANLLSTSITGTATTSGSVVIGGTFGNNPYNSVGSTRLLFGGGNEPNNYFIGTNLENYGGNYTKLDLRWHTGIRMGAQPGYGGIRFFNNETLGSRIMSIGESDANVRIDNNLWIGGAGGWITDLFNAKYSTSGGAIGGYVRINQNWGGGDYSTEQLTIRGTYPSITLRSTQHDSKWLMHHADSLQFYFGGTVDNNSWSNKIQFATDGNIWSAYYGDWLSNIFNSKQNASTAITTSNIGSQSVSYATSAGSATSASNLQGYSAYALVQESRGYHSGSDFTSGTLVTTDIDANGWAGDSFVMEVSGKSYSGSDSPFKLIMQGYLYADTIINVSAMSYGSYFPSPVKVMRLNGNLAFWWPRGSYWNSFEVHVRNANGDSWNRVTGIDNSSDPAEADKKISITPIQVLHTSNAGYAYNMNQYVRTSDSVTFANVYTAGWFRNYGNQGIYNQDYGTHFYSNGGASWAITGSGGNVELQFRSNHQNTIRGYVYADTSNQIGFLSEDGSWVLRTWNRGVEAYGSMRAPIFYDSNDTNYYLDPNSTSVLNRVYTTGRLEVTYNTDRYQMNFLRSSGSNWWVTNDSDKLGLHLNDVGDKFYFSTGGDFYSDANGWLSTALAGKSNTGHTHDDRYYTESEIDSQISNRLYQVSVGTLNVNDFNGTGLYRGSTGSWSNRPTVVHNGGALLQIDTHPGNYHSQLFFDTGGDRLYFRNANAGTWGSWLTMIHSGNIGSQSVNYATSAGNADTVDGYHESSFWRDGQDRRIGALRFSGEGGNSGNGVLAYGICQEGGDWTHPYPDLRIAFHTGIKLGANAGYEGIRFYTDYDMSSQVMSVNNGSDPLGQGNVYVNNSLQAGSSLRAPIFYDSQNTGYYGDFASTSVMNAIRLGTSTNNGTISGGADWGIRFANDNGWIQFGPANNSWTHIYTDKDFYFNQNLYVNGTQVVLNSGTWSINISGNAGSATSATTASSSPLLSALADYVFTASTNGRSFSRGIQTSFVSASEGYPQYGSVVRIATYSGTNDGGTAELYFPYSATYGGSSMRYRLGLYSNAGWTGWKTVIDSDNIGSQSVSYADESGFAASAGSVEWTSVQNKPATFSPSSHTHAISDVTGLQTALDGKQASGSYAAASHTHAIADVTGLQAALDGKQAAGSYAAASHTHTFASLTSKPTTISGYGITDAITTGNIGSQSVSSASGVSITGFGDNSFTYHQTPGNVHGWTGGWASHFIGNHGNGDTYYSQSIIMPFWGVPRYQRNEGGNKVGPWQFITEENIAAQSVSFATTSGSATSSTTANRLDNYGINYGSDWNTWGVYGKLVASSFHDASGANKPPTYTYGSFLSFLNAGADSFQIAIPENQFNGTGKARAMHFRSAWNGTWSSWRQVVDIQNNICDILADGTSTLIVRQGVGYNQPFNSNIEIHGSVDDWAYGKFRFRVQNESGTEPVYGAQFRIERFSVNTGWQLLGMVPRGSQNLEWQGDILPGLSDQRVKENVVSLTDGVATVQQINPVEFDWKPVENVSEREGHDIGFIAQQLEEIVPTAVHTRSDGYKTVKYEKVVPILVQAIKEQQSMIEQLSARLSALEQK